MRLEEIRRKIDDIDRELLCLHVERHDLSLRTRHHKALVEDRSREETVLLRAQHTQLGLVEPDFAGQVFKSIIEHSKQLQERVAHLVGFQGDHGSYSEVAARALIPDGAFIPCARFGEVFDGVAEGELDLAVVPVENSLEGTVTPVNELLTRTELAVRGEVSVPVRHCLLAPVDADHREIRAAYSHPQALAQCRGFLERNRLEPRPYYDTAGAARMVARDRPPGAAAIASALSAELHGMQVLKEGVADDRANTTRFLLLGREPIDDGDKCSIVFSVAHQAGRLHGVLELFAEAGINLSRIASMPQRGEPGNYSFFLDFEGSDQDEQVGAVIDRTRELTGTLRFLGCYPSAR
ncbi:MAG: chorismate mutase [Deltaproteobacteria bacterium]|nr:chorismate mutase [Deltaproteobacteria bacterium]